MKDCPALFLIAIIIWTVVGILAMYVYFSMPVSIPFVRFMVVLIQAMLFIFALIATLYLWWKAVVAQRAYISAS